MIKSVIKSVSKSVSASVQDPSHRSVVAISAVAHQKITAAVDQDANPHSNVIFAENVNELVNKEKKMENKTISRKNIKKTFKKTIYTMIQKEHRDNIPI